MPTFEEHINTDVMTDVLSEVVGDKLIRNEVG